MPIFIGNSTVNSNITSTTFTVNNEQNFLEFNSTRNSIMPALRFDFINSTTLDPRLTFTRSGSATYLNSVGIISTAPANTPRYDYNPSTLALNGILIEESATNLMNGSAAIGGSYWYYEGGSNGAVTTSNANVAPDGTTTATLLIPGTISSFYGWGNTTPGVYVDNTFYTFSVFVKLSGSFFSIIHLQALCNASTNSGYFDAWFKLTGAGSVLSATNTAGTSTGAYGLIYPYPNGWYRCVVGGKLSVGATGITGSRGIIRPSLSNGDNNMGSGGDGVSGYFYWGAQFEKEFYPTSYIPTTTAAVTRNPDYLYMPNVNQYFINSSNGTVISQTFFTFVPTNTGQGHTLWVLSDQNNNSIQLYNQVAQQFAFLTSNYNGTGGLNGLGGAAITNGLPYKHAVTWTASGVFSAFSGGNNLGSQAVSLPVNLNILLLGSYASNGGEINGCIQRWAYYPATISAAELITQTG